jgi:hypothetical protein
MYDQVGGTGQPFDIAGQASIIPSPILQPRDGCTGSTMQPIYGN